MKATHRIYLRNVLAQEPQQAGDITSQFFDINVEAAIEQDEARWYRVTGAGGRPTFKMFHDAEGEGVHRLLGMRMLLQGNRWYANAQDLDLGQAYEVIQAPLAVPLRVLVFLALAGLLALIVALGHEHPLGLTFTWKQYWIWAVGMLAWMAVQEWQEGRR